MSYRLGVDVGASRSCEVTGVGSRAPEETGKPTEIP